ncbi:MAG: hypothetical protein D6788_07805 [Planctomycetota bacterium]|nr:MAG: hypothetical protein D6788_07805 [Planctomycetota bacterium]
MPEWLGFWLVGVLMPVLSTGQEAPDRTALAREGMAALKSHHPVLRQRPLEYFFSLQLGPDTPVGYGRTRLQAAGENGSYRYENESLVAFSSGAKVMTRIEAKLSRTFEPVEIVARQLQITVDGKPPRLVVTRIRVGAKDIRLITESDNQKEEQTKAKPAPPLVYGIETVLTLLNFDAHPRALLRELDPQTAEARELIVQRETWEDGTPTIVTRTPDGTGSYQLWFDRGGELIRWAEPTIPVMFVRVGREPFQKLRDRFGPVRIPAEDKAPASGSR